MSKPRVFVSRVIPAAGLDRVQAACETEVWPERLPPPYDVLREKVRGVDGLLCLLTDRIDGEFDGRGRIATARDQPDCGGL